MNTLKTYIGLAALFLVPFLCHCTTDALIQAYELQGTYCESDHSICLTVTQSTTARYTWTINGGQCVERGKLTGGLQFTPDTESERCLEPTFGSYSAACEWTNIGINCRVSGSDYMLTVGRR